MISMVSSIAPVFDISKKIPEINAKIARVLSKIVVSLSRFSLYGLAEDFDD
jgi:hypothetical protein